ncbi:MULTISPECIES: UDP-N-acetylglucosamine 2-epimerase (non-hydrolyzing) [Oleiagrimonas]|uniref:UDP-N-acetylglucosamine 2-epimerase (non-hydrolyzing) n=1 Tax=Oleiagrimonas citrea TaxID=1665687 RepID=A0A846ZKT6_9GAMM|nr:MULTISPECIES: UDP-N-acetylglucosamine 2-epimerase (non-hydrolyzing) [Oleiagrimonas]NKZ38021.1 UDP-N-acetylglucosamine 2-epimerase (non-hydrolyzing) [Oleiagrimonas citrea]RAP57507.1 UDP-N-acetylglucosamine 2-epimerase (non-hydrolyzing) [Oleiagrimonas sp. MCCC 1A03011]
MHDILMVSGTRPEVIKLAPLYHALRATSWARPCWLHTGQHDAMARQMHGCFDIVPDLSLNRGGESLTEFSAGCRLQLDAILASRSWSLTVVQGDTESTYLGALTSFYQHVPVAHVEAGLRTGNLQRPFPEEGLRQMISRITRFHFAPTDRAAASLHEEGIPSPLVTVTGNTVVDAQHWVVKHRRIRRSVRGRGHLLVTAHRRENWGSDMEAICRAVAEVARRHPDLPVHFPVHLNPVVQRPVHAILGDLDNVLLTPPMDYLQMQQALVDAWLVLTDSGGLQEEAPTFGVPLLVLRNETERPEAIERGCARLAGTQSERIVAQVEALWNDREEYMRMCHAGNPFGDGHACEHIERVLHDALRVAETAPMATVA